MANLANLRGKIALVTGASRGVGRGIAHELGAAGALVYVTGRSVRGAPATENLRGDVHDTADLVTQAGGVGIPVQCDHTQDAQVDALFARIRRERARLDILVNNVWGGYERYADAPFDAPFWQQPLWRWQLMFDAGLRAHFTASRAAAPLMIPQRSGIIIHISAGDENKYRGQVTYDVAKAAVDRLAFATAQDLRPHNVAVLALHPRLHPHRARRAFRNPRRPCTRRIPPLRRPRRNRPRSRSRHPRPQRQRIQNRIPRPRIRLYRHRRNSAPAIHFLLIPNPRLTPPPPLR